MGSAHETDSIPLTEYCREFLAQRRGARRLESILKGGRRAADLKILCFVLQEQVVAFVKPMDFGQTEV